MPETEQTKYATELEKKLAHYKIAATKLGDHGRTDLQNYGRKILEPLEKQLTMHELRYLQYILVHPFNSNSIISSDRRIELYASLNVNSEMKPELLSDAQELLDYCRNFMSQQKWPYLDEPLNIGLNKDGTPHVSFQNPQYAQKKPVLPDGILLEKFLKSPRTNNSSSYSPIGYTSQTAKKVLDESPILPVFLAFTEDPYNALNVSYEDDDVIYTGVLKTKKGWERECLGETRFVTLTEEYRRIDKQNVAIFLMERTGMPFYQTIDTLIQAFGIAVPLRADAHPNEKLARVIGACNNPDLMDYYHAEANNQSSVSELIKK